jgi:hypothetical protein
MPRTTTPLTLLVSLVLFATLIPSSRATLQLSADQSNGTCPPLPAPSGTSVDVSTVAELLDAVNNSGSNTTIRVADGTYELHGANLWIDTPGVTLRSASGNREAAVIDGNYETTEMITVAASNVTIADLTLKRAYTHPIHVVATPDADTEDTLIYNVRIIDPAEQAIKINPDEDRSHFPDGGLIACSHIELTDAGRPHIRNGCYTGRVDGQQARSWVIRDNVIEGFWCESGLSEHGIHFWTGSRDTVVERNMLSNHPALDCPSRRRHHHPALLRHAHHRDGLGRCLAHGRYIVRQRRDLHSTGPLWG